MDNAINRIILDTEFIDVSSLKKGLQHETLEIGAVKIDEGNNVVDEFNYITLPSLSSSYSERADWLLECSIGQNICDIGSFEEGITSLCNWIDSEETEVYTWSEFDLHLLVDEVKFKCSSEDAETIAPYFYKYVDLQKMYIKSCGCTSAPHLNQALLRFGLKYEGFPHFALDDARNTARLYERIQSRTPNIKNEYLKYCGKLIAKNSFCYDLADEKTSFADFMPECLKNKYCVA